ncbi:MAG TPA: hypothetical protein VJA66_07740, partial [Thermoanaerobaculia bacterium]
MSARRVLFLAAAVSTAAALALPLWGFRMSAPQYPGESLHLRVTRTAIAGDVREVETLQKYIGVRFPTRLPELEWISAAIGSLGLLLALAGLLGEGKSGRAARRVVAGLLLVFLVASALFLQKRLYDVGHQRDPHAPIQAVRDFTPPAVGPVHVGNFTVWSYP